MEKKWNISPKLQTLIYDKLKQHAPDGVSSQFYPSIIWCLGGIIHNGDDESEVIRPHYALGWIKNLDLYRFIALEHKIFKYVAFEPSQEDLISPNSTLDFIDNNIVVS